MEKDLKNLYLDLGLTYVEFCEIVKRLGREPNETEIYLFSAMWSEHCGYKHSKKYLSLFPKKNSIYAEENAGGIKVGSTAVLFKIESHNHPSAVEPFQGSATGIGGIVRDILALGARPVAFLDSLSFGDIKYSNRAKYLTEGVVRGISIYGNSIGVPTVAGEVKFDKCYETNPLVNVMAVGIVKADEIKTSIAKPDNYVVLLGSYTGRDGIHGASFASKEFGSDIQKDRPSVQIADAFTKKILIEATLEILKSKNIIACQDCGAAGILSSTSEMAYKGKCGMELFLEDVHLRESGMKPWEIMLSESQERMVFVANENGVNEILEIAKKYELPVSKIGKTVKENIYKLYWQEKVIAEVSPEILNNGIEFEVCEDEPSYIKEFSDKNCVDDSGVEDALEKILEDGNFASKNWVYSQYDYSVGNKTALAPATAGACGILLREEKGNVLGITLDSNGEQVFLNPYEGSCNVVFEASRNLISSGFEPLGITDCLNFGNPEKDEVGYQFSQSVRGIAEACRELKIPVVSGNVSFYNENSEVRVYPTPTIGMVGVADSVDKLIRAKFGYGEDVYLIGKNIEDESCIGASLFQKVCFDFLGGNIDKVDVGLEKKLKNIIFELRDKKVLSGEVDVSNGGIFGALLIGLFNGNSGFEGSLISTKNHLISLFGEITGRYLVSTKNKSSLEKICNENNVLFKHLGKTFVSDKIFIDEYEFSLNKLKNIWGTSIKRTLEHE